MSKHSTRIACLVIIALAASCGSRERAEEKSAGAPGPAAPVEVFSGFAVYGDEVRSFRRCGTEEALRAVDRTGALWNNYDSLALHREPYEEIFCIVEGRTGPDPAEGFGAAYPGAIEITRILYMALEGFRCDLDLSRFVYRAYGNEPFWAVYIVPGGITLTMPGCEDKVWHEVRQIERDAGAVFIGSGAADSIEVRLAEVPCRDSMSGAYFAYSARVLTGEYDLRGWALKGTAGL